MQGWSCCKEAKEGWVSKQSLRLWCSSGNVTGSLTGSPGTKIALQGVPYCMAVVIPSFTRLSHWLTTRWENMLHPGCWGGCRRCLSWRLSAFCAPWSMFLFSSFKKDVFFKLYIFIYLAAPGHTCGTHDLQFLLRNAESSVVAGELFAVTCGI